MALKSCGQEVGTCYTLFLNSYIASYSLWATITYGFTTLKTNLASKPQGEAAILIFLAKQNLWNS